MLLKHQLIQQLHQTKNNSVVTRAKTDTIKSAKSPMRGRGGSTVTSAPNKP
jgi:hypothetical protein